MTHHEVLIVGGGTGGITVGAMLRNLPNPPQVTIIEPSEKHYYQPIWTLVGAGIFDKESSEKNTADYIPYGAEWIKDKVASFDPDNNKLTLVNGDVHSYDYLVVSAGIQVDWDKIPGLKESVGKAGTGVCSNYDYNTVDSTWENLQNLKSGNALFTFPAGPIKCGGAPLKITFLAEDYWRKHGVRNNINVKYIKPGASIFSVEKYRKTFARIAEERDIEQVWKHELIALRPDQKEAVFKKVDSGEEVVMKYDMIHVSPPMSAPDFLKNSPLAADNGFVEVDKGTTQHVRYPNVFALGDCSNMPTSKTGAAIRKQAPVTVANMVAHMKSQPLPKSYDGYSSCPVVTGYGKLVLCEFDYNEEPCESFPFDQSKERYSMYALKAFALPRMYWHGMLRGREF